MDILELLKKVADKEISINEAYNELKDLPIKDIEFAKIDTHREIRKKLPEVIFCIGKTVEQVVEIIGVMKQKSKVIATKANEEIMSKVKERFPEARIYKNAGIIFLGQFPEELKGNVVILTAGTADIPVATEAEIVLKVMGVRVQTIFDVGVAGIHRVLKYKDVIKKADAIIVVAGMDGILPTIVAGLFDIPVIGVPTSIGYGTNLKGIAPLLTMLNSCATGVAVVNIDNGFGGAYFAGLIALKKSEDRR